jgi:hypothetical protein
MIYKNTNLRSFSATIGSAGSEKANILQKEKSEMTSKERKKINEELNKTKGAKKMKKQQRRKRERK